MKKEFSYRGIVNHRIHSIPDYDQKHVTTCWNDHTIKRLMSNESSFPPIKAVQEAICHSADLANFYAEDPTYTHQLREFLAHYCDCKKDNITLGNGSIELLDLLFQTLINAPEKDEVILIQPDYSAYTPRLIFYGARIRHASANIFFIDTGKEILKAITANTRLILFSRPNNPLGTLMPKESVLKILDAGIPLIIDEAYIEMADKGSSLVGLIKDYPHLIVLRTFSKGFGLAGLRLGYVIAHQDLIMYLNRAKHIFNVNLIAMRAAVAAFEHINQVQSRFQEIINIRNETFTELSSIKNLSPIPSQANFIMIDTCASVHSAAEYVSYLLKKGYMTRDFSSKAGLKENSYFRVSVGLRQDMKNVIHEIKNF